MPSANGAAKATVSALGIMPGSTEKGSASEPYEAMKALRSSPVTDLGVTSERHQHQLIKCEYKQESIQ